MNDEVVKNLFKQLKWNVSSSFKVLDEKDTKIIIDSWTSACFTQHDDTAPVKQTINLIIFQCSLSNFSNLGSESHLNTSDIIIMGRESDTVLIGIITLTQKK